MANQTTIDLPSTIEQAVEAYKNSGGDHSYYVVSQSYIDTQMTELIKQILGTKKYPSFDSSVDECNTILIQNNLIDQQLERAREKGFDV